MNAVNRPKGKRTQTPASIVTDVKPLQERTSEEVRAIQQRRIIDRASQRIEHQRKIRLELKAKLKVQPKTATPTAHPGPRCPVFNSASISSPVAPAFSQHTLKRFDMAVKGLKAQGRSLNQRLLICHHHLRSDPVLAAIDPRELWRELSSPNQ